MSEVNSPAPGVRGLIWLLAGALLLATSALVPLAMLGSWHFVVGDLLLFVMGLLFFVRLVLRSSSGGRDGQ